MFIVEGSDSLGKTTVAKKIMAMVNADSWEALKYPVHYSHMTRPPKCFDFFGHYQDRICSFAVQDRFHLGARAYHDGVLPDNKLHVVQNWIYAAGSFILLMVADPAYYATCLRRDSKDQMFNDQVLVNANLQFIELARAGWCDVCFRASPAQPYPTDEQIAGWAEVWMHRVYTIKEQAGGHSH